MPALPAPNRDHQAKIEQAVFKAIIDASTDHTACRSPILPGEIVQACLTAIAFVAAMSPATTTRRGTRRFTEDAAKTLRLRIPEAREHRLNASLDFLTVASMARRY